MYGTHAWCEIEPYQGHIDPLPHRLQNISGHIDQTFVQYLHVRMMSKSTYTYANEMVMGYMIVLDLRHHRSIYKQISKYHTHFDLIQYGR